MMVFKLKGQITYFDSCKVPGTGINLKPDGPIAQLDRVPDYESGGRGFESSSVRHHPVSPNLNKSQIVI